MQARTTPLRVALTGGIASGKSTVAELFGARGISVIDTDRIAREIVASGQPALAEIRAAFGEEVIDPEGRLDRARLRERVFADPTERRRLATILHPRIMRVVDERSRAGSGPYLIVVVPLLVEAGLTSRFDRVLVVDCPERQQIARLMTRDGESRSSAERMLAAQASRQERLALADDILVNDGTLVELAPAVEQLDRQYRELASTARP